MGQTRRVVAVLATGLVFTGGLSGCASLESGGAPPGDEDAATAVASRGAKPMRARSWTGAQATNYDHSYRICSVFTVREIARDMGVAAKPRIAAEAHARQLYAAQFRRAAFEGCLDAFQGRPPGVR